MPMETTIEEEVFMQSGTPELTPVSGYSTDLNALSLEDGVSEFNLNSEETACVGLNLPKDS